MRIAIATETFLPATDGICTRFANMAVEMKRMGHEVIIISPDLGITEYQGIPVYGMETFNFALYGSRPWGKPNKAIKKILKEFKPDVVHAVNPFIMVTSAVHYAKKLDIPLLTSYHTHIPNYLDHYHLPLLKPLLWEYLRFWHQGSDINLTVSASLAQELEEQAIDVHGVMPRGIDLSQRDPEFFDQDLYQELTFGLPDQKLLVYVGRLAAEKDIDQLRAIFNYRHDICLAIVGDGPEKENLERLFAGTKTTFVGFKFGQELAKAFATADAFIFPSTSETFGLVISEAMASGLPVIAAESGPTLEQIQPLKTGVCFESHNEASLIEALDCLDQPLLMQAMGLQARSEAQKYSWQAAASCLVDYYEQAINHHFGQENNCSNL
ncbi:glycosyltransferase family 4 protein [Vaginisenegalia massiliensis]|uniref:glycosyltransferase family 4 protein n=1 Tax=Vaginisenegalia massiliensis TaxID=2058294 RepID=UPI000F53C7A3|nr:glycosyltransferase family 1 protein [Vaginisenegalia massiliensis]